MSNVHTKFKISPTKFALLKENICSLTFRNQCQGAIHALRAAGLHGGRTAFEKANISGTFALRQGHADICLEGLEKMMSRKCNSSFAKCVNEMIAGNHTSQLHRSVYKCSLTQKRSFWMERENCGHSKASSPIEQSSNLFR